MKIKELCKEERPREMLAEKGARALSNSQLLAILLGSGTRKANVLEVANRLLARCGGDLRALARTGADRMQETEGIGAARYATLAAALELGRRCWSGNGGAAAPAIHGAADTYALMAPLLRGLGHEECWIILLNRRNRPVFKGMVSQGDTGETAFPLGPWSGAHPPWCSSTTTRQETRFQAVPTSSARRPCARPRMPWGSCCWTTSSSVTAGTSVSRKRNRSRPAAPSFFGIPEK